MNTTPNSLMAATLRKGLASRKHVIRLHPPEQQFSTASEDLLMGYKVDDTPYLTQVFEQASRDRLHSQPLIVRRAICILDLIASKNDHHLDHKARALTKSCLHIVLGCEASARSNSGVYDLYIHDWFLSCVRRGSARFG